MTPEIVSAYLRLNRAIGSVVVFIGFSKSAMSDDDQKSLNAALAELDAASDALQKIVYAIGGIK